MSQQELLKRVVEVLDGAGIAYMANLNTWADRLGVQDLWGRLRAEAEP